MIIIFFVIFFAVPTPAQTSQQNPLPADSSGTINNVLDRTSSLSDSLAKLQQIPAGYLNKINEKATKLNQQLTNTTVKSLDRIKAEEIKINGRLSKIDSVTAHNLLANSIDSISNIQQIIKNRFQKFTEHIPGREYLPMLDTIQTSLKFLSKYAYKLSQFKNIQSELNNSIANIQQLEGKLTEVQNAEQYIQDQQQLLTDALKQYGGLFSKDLNRIGQDAYYYQAEIKNYRDTWSDPDKMEALAINILDKVPAFDHFMQQNSLLSSLFRESGTNVQNLTGLQTVSGVNNLIQQRMAGASPQARDALSQQLGQIQQELSTLKSKFPALNSNGQMPDFRPNEMKGKTFFQRLEYGANMQSEKATGFLPTTSDIAGQIAYKFSQNGSIGTGLAFKLGWGSSIQKIHFTAQGLELRSFLDYKLKGTFFVNGGFDFNYNTTIPDIPALKNLNSWTKSALLGIERKYKIKNKLNGEVMLLYDFLHNKHIPVTSPIVFRIGYTF